MPLPNATIDNLITAHLDRARILALSIAVMYHDVDRDDAIASANLALVEAAQRYQDQGHQFWTYARHSIVGAVRDLARPSDPPMISGAEEFALAPDSDVGPRILTEQLLAGLGKRARRVLIAHYWHGHALCEIAEAMRLTPARVGQIRNEALDQLRARLGVQVTEATEHPGQRALATRRSLPRCSTRQPAASRHAERDRDMKPFRNGSVERPLKTP